MERITHGVAERAHSKMLFHMGRGGAELPSYIRLRQGFMTSFRAECGLWQEFLEVQVGNASPPSDDGGLAFTTQGASFR